MSNDGMLPVKVLLKVDLLTDVYEIGTVPLKVKEGKADWPGFYTTLAEMAKTMSGLTDHE